MLNESIIKIRVELQNAKLKMSGKNEFAGFTYYELKDFLPKLNELMLEEKINDKFTIENEEVILTLIKGEEKQEYKMPFVLFDTPLTFKKNKSGEFLKDKDGELIKVPSMQDIQYLGALNTYYKRYLYLNAFGITDGDVISGMNPDESGGKVKTATQKQITMLEKYYKDENLTKLLEENKISELKEMPMTKASEIIKKLMDKAKKEVKENE